VDIQFYEPEEAARPPDEITFRRFAAEPLEDGRRVRLSLSITPFQQRPSIEIELFDPSQRPVARTSIVEATDVNMSLTVHLRGEVDQGEYTAQARLYYPPNPPVDQAQALFHLPPIPPSE
jgi:hypothetical protein